jgi:Outer membrane lipoprotein-sorting protein
MSNGKVARHLAFILFLWAPVLPAQDAAREIVAEAQRRTESKSQQYEGILQVLGSDGRVADKRWRFERIGAHGASRSVLRFVDPPDVRGVALLVVNHPDQSSDQWMWTPALQRERRIALQDRSTRFFGTDFSFEDLEEWDVNQFSHRLLGEELLGNAKSWRIESSPSSGKKSQYTRLEIWIHQDSYVLLRIDKWIKNEVVRRLSYADFEQVQGIWTARRLEMADLRRNSHTALTIDKLQYNLPMQESNFTLQALRRE